ncbi:MAG TPA: NBR1-Ig-like domain-containing protein [Anaerolineae bacterium]|nr:NBR1-Ig-like domain-containing protein [Anaerolineae bacterium]
MTTKEKAIEASQVSHFAQPQDSSASVGYFEPSELPELAVRGRLFLIADPVGGSSSSLVASRYAIQKILHQFYSTNAANLHDHLLDIIKQTNLAILARNSQHPEHRVLATTVMAAWIKDGKLFVANVGDNRAFVVWDQDIERLREIDPAVTEAQPQNGKPTGTLPFQSQPATEISPHPFPPAQPGPDTTPRERRPHGLGLEAEIKIQTFARKLFAGDIVVMCSGGLTGYIGEKEIAQLVNKHAPAEASHRLVELACERGCQDQMAVSIIKMLPEPVTEPLPHPIPLPAEPDWHMLTKAGHANGHGQHSTQARFASPLDTRPLPNVEPLTSKKSPTQPLASGTPARTFGDPKLTQSFAEVFNSGEYKTRLYLMGALVALLVLAVGFGWPYLIPAGSLESVPVLASLDGWLRGDESPETELAAVRASNQSETTGATAPELGPTFTPTPPSVTLVTSDRSPVATPHSTGASLAGSTAAEFQTTDLSGPEAGNQAATDNAVTTVSDRVEVPPSPTPQPPIAVPLGCQNRARFYRDVTVPDGTQFSPGEKFEKVWLLTNADTCPWGPGYTVRYLSGEQMSPSPSAPLTERVEPETNGEIKVALVAPEKPGVYRGVWQLHDLKGEPFGPELYLEIEVLPPDPTALVEEATLLYDFIANADQALWRAGGEVYKPVSTAISETIELERPQALVATGPAQLRGNQQSTKPVLLTYPNQEYGFVEGVYTLDTSLQPTDALVAEVGFTKLSILSDDGVTFEVIFTPTDGSKPQAIFSARVQYRDSPVAKVFPLTGVKPGQTGTFTVRVLGGDSLSQDWAIWIDLRLVRGE